MTHTKGEWRADHSNVLSNKEWIAECYGETTERSEANALLMATAPELLEACTYTVKILKSHLDKYPLVVCSDKLQQAITKAEGNK